jgi:hypothetical protein
MPLFSPDLPNLMKVKQASRKDARTPEKSAG